MAESNLPVVNAIEELKETNVAQTRALKDSISNLQSSIRTGLAMNRGEIASMHNTLMRAFGINEEMLELSKRIRMEEYERWLEEQRKNKIPEKKVSEKTKKDDGLLLSLLGLGGLASIVTGVVASLTGLDAAIKAVKLPDTFRGIGKTFDAIGDFFGKIKALRFPELPKINWVDVDGNPFSAEKSFGIKLPDAAGIIEDIKVRSFVVFDDLRISTVAKFDELKLGFLKRIDNIIGAFNSGLDTVKATLIAGGEGGTLFTKITPVFTGLVDEFTKPIRLLTESNPFTEKVESIKTAFGDFFDRLPRIDSIEFPTWAKELPSKVATILGNADEGTGIIGFFSKAFKFLEPALKPLKFVVQTVLRPFTQFVLTFIDFVTGFYDGFNAEDGTLEEKLLAGIEGGVLGVIKGITEAIDLIFFQLPAWIAEKLGFEELSKSLGELSITELVDPVWNGIKEFFKRLFDDPAALASDIGSSLTGGLENFLKSVLRSVLPIPDGSEDFFSIKNLVSKAIPDSVYEYAGINKQTGERIDQQVEPQIIPVDGAQIDVQSKTVEESKGGAGTSIVDASTSTTDARATISNQQITVQGASATRSKSSPQTRDVYGDSQVLVF